LNPAPARVAAPILAAGPDAAALRSRLAEGADEISGGPRSLLAHPRLLVVAAASLMTLGISAVILGWLGTAHSEIVEKQLPYIASGGFLGVALSTIGALLFFTHWLTIAVKEARQHSIGREQEHRELIAELQREHQELIAELRSFTLVGQGDRNGNARGDKRQRPLRGAPRGS
jgi:hypothetical protein